MIYAVIIKHRMRDNDTRVDLYEVPEEGMEDQVRVYAESILIGQFQVESVNVSEVRTLKLKTMLFPDKTK